MEVAMEKIKMMRRWKWALLLGGMAAVALLWGCLSPVSVPPPGGTSGTENPNSPSPAAPGTGIAGEEFIVTLGVGGEGPEASRSVVGPGAGGIQYGGIRNIVQVIQVDAGTGELVHFQQEVRKSDTEASVDLKVINLWPGKRYHILVLTGHRERNYAQEKFNDDGLYVYYDTPPDNRPPTLLAAGLLADREIQSGEKTLSIPMQPLAVDTVFAYGGGTVDAALPTQAAPGGTALPAGAAASIVWTLGGGIETLRDAQAGLTFGGIGLNWGNPFIPHDAILNNWNGSGSPAIALADNRITLDLGPQDAEVSGSANFNLDYRPFGASTMSVFKDADGKVGTSWIIRNGVNDEAQDDKTVFPNTASKVSPWDGDTKNGNGAVVFTFVPEEISHIDLTGLVPAPVTGAAPVKEIKAGISKQAMVTWKATGGKSLTYFEGETIYSARVTLEAGTGFLFRTLAKGGVTVTHGGSSVILYILKTDTTVVADVLFPKTDAVWEYGGYFSGSSAPITGNMDSAIDIIRQAKTSSLSLKLLPWPETVNLGTGMDIGMGLSLTTANSPAEVILDGGGKTIPLTAGNQGSVITVGDGVTLTLKNITFKGSETNNAPLIKVNTGGKLVLEDGAVITGNDYSGVSVAASGKLVLADGALISGKLVLESGALITGNVNVIKGGELVLESGVVITDNVDVLEGGKLVLESGAVITGNVNVKAGVNLVLAEGAAITGNVNWDGDFSGSSVTGDMDSAIDIMKLAKGLSSLSLKLPLSEEPVDFSASNTDIGTGLTLTHIGNTDNSPPR
jgi:hypothetical protein